MRRKADPQQRRENRQVFGRDGTATSYKIREKLVSFGDDFWIEDENGRRAGRAFLRDALRVHRHAPQRNIRRQRRCDRRQQSRDARHHGAAVNERPIILVPQ